MVNNCFQHHLFPFVNQSKYLQFMNDSEEHFHEFFIPFTFNMVGTLNTRTRQNNLILKHQKIKALFKYSMLFYLLYELSRHEKIVVTTLCPSEIRDNSWQSSIPSSVLCNIVTPMQEPILHALRSYGSK